jgi:ribose 5-phosphate isomerase B
VVLGSDHAGLRLKKAALELLGDLGHEAEDLGPTEPGSVDYPDYGHRVARAVAEGRAELGVLVCGTGIGMSMAANRHAGVRAALCRTAYEARMARQHNDANVLCLGERVTGEGLAAEILEAFLASEFEGGRHGRRVGKIEILAAEGQGRARG